LGALYTKINLYVMYINNNFIIIFSIFFFRLLASWSSFSVRILGMDFWFEFFSLGFWFGHLGLGFRLVLLSLGFQLWALGLGFRIGALGLGFRLEPLGLGFRLGPLTDECVYLWGAPMSMPKSELVLVNYKINSLYLPFRLNIYL